MKYAALLALLLAGCGGGSDGAAADPVAATIPASHVTGFCAPADTAPLGRPWIGTGPRLLVIGDSLMEGIQPELRFPGYATLNAGVSGNCTTQVEVRFARDALAQRPDVIVMNGGINDIWQGLSSIEYLSRAALSARRAGVTVIIVGVYRPSASIAPADYLARLDAFHGALAAFSRQQGIPYIDNTGPDVLPDLGPDNVHLTEQGRENLAAKIRRALKEAI